MYVLCLVGFCPGILDIWLTIRLLTQNRNSSRLEHQRLLLRPAFQYHAVWWI